MMESAVCPVTLDKLNSLSISDCSDGSDEADEFGNSFCASISHDPAVNPLYYSNSISSLNSILFPYRNYTIWRSLYEKKQLIRKTAEITVEINDIEFNHSQSESLDCLGSFSPTRSFL